VGSVLLQNVHALPENILHFYLPLLDRHAASLV